MQGLTLLTASLVCLVVNFFFEPLPYCIYIYWSWINIYPILSYQLVQDGQTAGGTPGLGQSPAVSTPPPDMTLITWWSHLTLTTLTPRPGECRTGRWWGPRSRSRGSTRGGSPPPPPALSCPPGSHDTCHTCPSQPEQWSQWSNYNWYVWLKFWDITFWWSSQYLFSPTT